MARLLRIARSLLLPSISMTTGEEEHPPVDRDARIMARRQRIQERIGAKAGDSEGAQTSHAPAAASL